MIVSVRLLVWADHSHLVEVDADDLPNVRPFESDTAHVVVGNVHQLLQREQSRLRTGGRRLDLLPGHLAEGFDKVDNCRLWNISN